MNEVVIMSKTVGCSDFGYACEFRITAGDDDVQVVEDVATKHALERHPESAPDEPSMRAVVRSQIKSLFAQSHTDFEPEAIH